MGNQEAPPKLTDPDRILVMLAMLVTWVTRAVQTEPSAKQRRDDRAEYDSRSVGKVAGLLIGGVVILPSERPRHAQACLASLAVCVGAGDRATLTPHSWLAMRIASQALPCPRTTTLLRATRTVWRKHHLLATYTDLRGPSTRLRRASDM